MTDAPPPPAAAQRPLTQADQKLWGTLIHIGAGAGHFLFGGWLGWVAPLIGFLLTKDRDSYLREQSRRALNFQLTLAIAVIVGYILAIVLIGWLLVLAAWVVNIIFTILAAIAANRMETYHYPFSINFVK